MALPSKQVTVARASVIALGALLVGLAIGIVLPAVVPTLADLGPGESCTQIQNEYHEVRSQLDVAEGDDVVEPAAALFELAERRPDCFGDKDLELIEGFRTFVDQDG
ncbi:MAG: hypothetical protein R6U94_04340 [Nitriliruptoraceae bacterium]